MNKALITCPVHPMFTEELETHGIEYIYLPDIKYDECYEILEDFTILVVSTSVRVDRSLIDRGDRLQIIGRVGSGMEHIDVAYAQKKGVQVLSSPAGNARSVAEHVMGMMLSYSKKIGTSEYEVKEGVWRREANRGMELENKKIGIIGYGHNGSITAHLCAALGMKVYVYDKYKEVNDDRITSSESLEKLISEGMDFLSFHVPYNDETHHYLDYDLIASAPKPFVVINISRGEIVDSKALADALEIGDVTAALLDVVENERSVTNKGFWSPEDESTKRLRDHPRVFITPHIAGYSVEAFYKMSQILVTSIVSEL